MLRRLNLLLLFTALLSCADQKFEDPAIKDQPLTSYVNPFIGTGGHGHTYPGATMPFGMVQLSPDTRLEGWDGCSGYHYSDDYIYGFSHTHLSGTGVSDYGDILLAPTDTLVFNNGANGEPGYGSHFSHEREDASPGYYQVLLEDSDIAVELTVTPRAGMHRYHFPSSENQFLILDLEHRDQLLDHHIEQVDPYDYRGYRRSRAWAEDQFVFFYLRFSHAAAEVVFTQAENDSRNVKMGVKFENPNNEPVTVKVGISAVDMDGALLNLDTEVGDSSFDRIRKDAAAIWEEQLEKIVVESPRKDEKANFYTALYHSMLAPNLYQDVDGRYRGMDLQVQHTYDFDYYTVFSLWDTYRATHPLFTLIEQERSNHFINTLLAKYDEGGILPIWDLSSNYTGCMIGYHSLPVIADAYLKGIRGYDAEKALEAMVYSTTRDHLGLEAYRKYGFIPVEEESESVSKTLEYAFDDWTLARMAEDMGRSDVAANYYRRAQYWKNVYDPVTGFMRGRFRNSWFEPFDPFEVNFNYTEANAWQYSMYVPQDINGHIDRMGGKEAYRLHLDQLFTAKSETSGRDQADITGLIGQYAHGNEPSHHMAYLYNFVNQPHKTQQRVRQILTELYTNANDGISGNEDCGQMSAWYVFSSLGFYPVTPGSNRYIIGSPLFDKATLNLENGDSFTVVAKNNGADRPYIKSARLNGDPLERSWLEHSEVAEGGLLEFEMSARPTSWATQDSATPRTPRLKNTITPAPFIKSGAIAFKDSTQITLGVADKEARIYYRLDQNPFRPYTGPVNLFEETVLEVYAVKEDVQSPRLTTRFYKTDPNIRIELESTYANQYSAGGQRALIDGIFGSADFRTGAWQGYQDQDVIATVDLGSLQPISDIRVKFLQDQRSWIFLPTEVSCYVSDQPNGYFKELGIKRVNSAERSDEVEIQTFNFPMNDYRGRYIKLVARKLGDLPAWHLGAPYNGKAWIFIDEIEIIKPDEKTKIP